MDFFGSKPPLRPLYFYRWVIFYVLIMGGFLFFLFGPEKKLQVNKKNFIGKNGNSLHSTLRVLTYSSFTNPWSPGPILRIKFKKETGIDIHWVLAPNAHLLEPTLRWKHPPKTLDVVLGLNSDQIIEMKKWSVWMDIRKFREKLSHNILPHGSQGGKYFMAFNWSPLTFIYKDGVAPPTHLDDLTHKKYFKSLILQNPRTNPLGFQFLLWVLSQKGSQKAQSYFQKLKNLEPTITPSWSSSYNIFQTHPRFMVFSYATSIYYHQQAEGDFSYQAAVFKNPHPVQASYVALTQTRSNTQKAQKFLEFLLRPDIQKIIMEKDFMFPVEGLALQHSKFKLFEKMNFLSSKDNLKFFSSPSEETKKGIINQWKKVF